MLSVYANAMPCHAMIYQFKEMPRVYDAKNALFQTMQQKGKDENTKMRRSKHYFVSVQIVIR